MSFKAKDEYCIFCNKMHPIFIEGCPNIKEEKKMTQKELIQKLKLELGKHFNENASFLVTQPFFKENTLGLKKDELINGIYVTLLDQNKAPMFDGNIYYFKVIDPEQYCKTLYNIQYKKYMFPLVKIGDWSTLICNETSYTKVKNNDLVDRPTVFPVPKELEFIEGVVNKLDKAVEEYKKSKVKPLIIEEFPIQKTPLKTTYRKRDIFIVIGKDINDRIKMDYHNEEIVFSEQQFSDLVDLMIEARKDLLK